MIAALATCRAYPPRLAPSAICGEARSDTVRSPTADISVAGAESAAPLPNASLSRLNVNAVVPRHPWAMPTSPKSSMGPPPCTSCKVKSCRVTSAAPSATKPPLTQCRSADSIRRSSAQGWTCHSMAPRLRPFKEIVPAEPCHRVPEKSPAPTAGGRKRFTIEAGRAMTMTVNTVSTTNRMKGRTNRDCGGGGGGLALCLGERDVGIHHSRKRGPIHRDGFDGETIALVERGQPRHQRVEGRGLQLHAYTRTAGLGPAQCAAQ